MSLQPRTKWLTGLAIAGLLLLILTITLTITLLSARRSEGLFPFRGSATPIPLLIDGQAQLVNFSELDDEAPEYQNLRIRITGQYFPLDIPDCTPYNGPLFYWSLVGEEKQVNALGFESVVRLAAPNTTMTVEGIWRWYDGPVGCGKEPEGVQGIWYLEVEQILAPNPIGGAAAAEGVATVAGINTPVFPTTGAGTAVFTATPLPPPPLETPTPPASATAAGGYPLPPTATATSSDYPGPGPNTTPTPTTFVLTATPTNTPPAGGTPPATPTPTGSLTPTPTVPPTATTGSGGAGGTATNTPVPLITSTPGSGYPIPTDPPPTAYP